MSTRSCIARSTGEGTFQGVYHLKYGLSEWYRKMRWEVTMTKVARAPNGKLIVGTYEKLSGRANTVYGSFERDEHGKLTFAYEGFTEIFWEEQKTVHKHGAPVFLDEDGFQWQEAEVLLSQE